MILVLEQLLREISLVKECVQDVKSRSEHTLRCVLVLPTREALALVTRELFFCRACGFRFPALFLVD